ncbi:TPA: hypothetical protein N0F65_000668 [Lagenidium giganteum]|uniref:Ion transport domain-containing protein n=1 Tax=Lagenidium giganteum TaxID=4803 RepID=A0AAV2YPV9_9STRA|nr:TPA: hypothetical protein N0F65_000668 [Lagenidium giganteum]
MNGRALSVAFSFDQALLTGKQVEASGVQDAYDTPEVKEVPVSAVPKGNDEEDDEVEIEIRSATPANGDDTALSAGGSVSPPMSPDSSPKSTRNLLQRLSLRSSQSTALEMVGDGPDNERPQTLRDHLAPFFRMPNSALNATTNWIKIDLSEDISLEQEEYGESRDGWFWQKTHELLFGSTTVKGQAFGVVLLLMITTSVILATMDSVEKVRLAYGEEIYAFEIFFTVVFGIEYVLRVSCLRKPSEYIMSAMGIVDVSSILPTFITFWLPEARSLADLATLRIFRVIRVFRVLRLVRFVDAARALKDNIDANKMRVAVFMFFVFSMIVVIGCTMYLIEGEEHGFSNIPVSLYWAVVTLTTVGYGDIAPSTVPGRFLAAIVMFAGYGVIACPLVLNTQTEEEALKLNCECPKCFRTLHQDDANFCRHCGSALRLPKAARSRKGRSKKAAPVLTDGDLEEKKEAAITPVHDEVLVHDHNDSVGHADAEEFPTEAGWERDIGETDNVGAAGNTELVRQARWWAQDEDGNENDEQRVVEQEEVVAPDWETELGTQATRDTRGHLLEADEHPETRAQVAVLEKPPLHEIDVVRRERAIPWSCHDVVNAEVEEDDVNQRLPNWMLDAACPSCEADASE